MTVWQRLLNTPETRRFLKFAVVGASGTLVDFVLLVLLVDGLRWPTLPANTLSYSVGVLNNFGLNRFWTFPDARAKPVLAQFAQFALINVVGLALNDAIVTLTENALHAWLGAGAVLAAKVVATGLVFFWNFFANRRWTYSDAV